MTFDLLSLFLIGVHWCHRGRSSGGGGRSLTLTRMTLLLLIGSHWRQRLTHRQAHHLQARLHPSRVKILAKIGKIKGINAWHW